MSSPVRLGASYHPATTTPPGCRSSCARLAALTGASTVLELQRSSSIFNLRRSLSWCSRAQPPPLPHPLGTRTVHTSPHPARWAHRTRYACDSAALSVERPALRLGWWSGRAWTVPSAQAVGSGTCQSVVAWHWRDVGSSSVSCAATTRRAQRGLGVALGEPY